ncbi:phosphate transporter [Nematocida minor]|uniref:phosphate transporter n=1 Tax=Nematocida minor TaxID=1912983 RepID=UPI002221193A|nr:phosphate transporter [Nematocida minor]KAI5190261.1 phosphate transporter [Nematocida minor]
MKLKDSDKITEPTLNTIPSNFGVEMGLERIERTPTFTPRMREDASTKELHPKKESRVKRIIGCLFITAAVSAYFVFTFKYPNVFPTRESLLCCIIACIASVFWSLHILPLDATSILLIPVIILSNIMVSNESGFFEGVFSGLLILAQIIVSPVLLLLMGSCLLSIYFQNNNGDRLILPYLMVGGDIYSDLFRSMFLALVLSSVMSNITAPIIITSILQNTSKEPTPAILMGIAMASNIGGMVLPISSPQSILGSSIMGLSWAHWLWISVPTAGVCFLFVYALIIFYFPVKESPKEPSEIVIAHSNRGTNTKLLVATIFSIVCWSIPSIYPKIKWIYGLPVCALLMTKNSSRVWNRKTLEIISIAVAGTAIGKGIERTKMLEGMISGFIIESKEKSLLFLVVASSFIMLTVSCMVCHTVSAIVLLPIFEKIGLYIGRERIIVGIASLACSCGMALPSSGFPNILSSSFKTKSGSRLISTKSFITVGTVSTMGCWVFILTVSLLFMLLAKF